MSYKKELILHLKEYFQNQSNFRVSSVYLFGSFLTNEWDKENSDIDILVRMKPFSRINKLYNELSGSTSLEAIRMREDILNYFSNNWPNSVSSKIIEKIDINLIHFTGRLISASSQEKIKGIIKIFP